MVKLLEKISKKKKNKEKAKWTGPQRKLKPEEKLNVACVGIGGKGNSNLNAMIDLDENVVAICDVDGQRLEATAKMAAEKGQTPKLYRDYRELLADPFVDAVVIGTPDHWHCQMVLDAARARKDIYCEKGWTQSIAEAKAMRKAVKEIYPCAAFLRIAREYGIPLPSAAVDAQLYNAMLQNGMGEQDNSAVIGIIEELAGTKLNVSGGA